jgi:hypothetical protein
MYVHQQPLESDMTNPMTTAHELTRREMNTAAGRAFYGTYAKCFADQLKAVYATVKYEAACDANFGPGLRPGFQVVGENRWY